MQLKMKNHPEYDILKDFVSIYICIYNMHIYLAKLAGDFLCI